MELDQLPNEMIIEISSHLSLIEMCRLSTVSQKYWSLLNHIITKRVLAIPVRLTIHLTSNIYTLPNFLDLTHSYISHIGLYIGWFPQGCLYEQQLIEDQCNLSVHYNYVYRPACLYIHHLKTDRTIPLNILTRDHIFGLQMANQHPDSIFSYNHDFYYQLPNFTTTKTFNVSCHPLQIEFGHLDPVNDNLYDKLSIKKLNTDIEGWETYTYFRL